MTTKAFDQDTFQRCVCTEQGNLFVLAWKHGYRMGVFIPAFMNSKVAEDIDSPYDRMQWSGEEYILHSTAREIHMVPECHPETHNEEALFWAGYIYRFWQQMTGESSKRIFATCGYPDILENYAGYHTLSCEMAIKWMKEDAARRESAA